MANINNNNKEPNTAPLPDKWYNLTLGSSFKDSSSTKFCTLRYEFKPASIDKSQPGSLHKNKENRVTVEFQNNQIGKPKVTFEGSSEDYKEHDAVLFFDGETFRLERLHRAVKRLRHVRLPGESATTVGNAPSVVGTSVESRSPPLGKGGKTHSLNRTVMHPAPVPVEVERIDVAEPGIPGINHSIKNVDVTTFLPQVQAFTSLDQKNYETGDNINVDIDIDGQDTPSSNKVESGFDMNLSNQNQNDTDDEIADVDLSDNEIGEGPNAAEALRAQVNAEGSEGPSSSTSGSSGSGSSGSGSGSGSSSSDSEASDNDTASSGFDIDV